MENILSHQAASRPNEVNCNVHETLVSNNRSRHEDNRKPFSTFKENTRGSLKNITEENLNRPLFNTQLFTALYMY